MTKRSQPLPTNGFVLTRAARLEETVVKSIFADNAVVLVGVFKRGL